MLNFKQYIIEESFTSNDEKVNQIAKRIWANVFVITNRYKRAQKDFSFFKTYGVGGSKYFESMHAMAIYKWLTQRRSGFETPNQDNTKAVQQMVQQMVDASNVNGVKYIKGAGWHHWVINGDMARSQLGTAKTYISVNYKTLLPVAGKVMNNILQNLVINGYKGQIKIATDAENGWLDRMDNIVLHSGSPEWAQFGAKIVKATLDKFKVKTGGLSTSGQMEQGLDPKGSGTSFNGFVSEKAESSIVKLLNNSNDYDEFLKNIQNYFAANGPFVQEIIKVLS